MKTALVIGATGMVGSSLVQLLLADKRFEKIIIFTRRTLHITDVKLVEHVIDFDKPAAWKKLVVGDVLFSTLGTTLKQAGSKKAQFKIDYTYQLEFAQAAAQNDVPVYVLVSSASANPDSKLFYTRMKGELERDIKKLPFQSTSIIQPGFLKGKRLTERMGEKISLRILDTVNALGLLKKYRPIHANIVAKAMVNAAAKAKGGSSTYTLDKVFTLAAGN